MSFITDAGEIPSPLGGDNAPCTPLTERQQQLNNDKVLTAMQDLRTAIVTAPAASYGGTYEFNEAGSAIALTSNVAFYRWITGQAGTVKGAGYVTWDNAAAPGGKYLTVGASGAGKYLVVATYAGNLDKKGDLEAVIYVNATIQNNIRADQKVVEDAQYTAGAVSGIVTLAAGDTVSLWFGASVNTSVLTLKHANLTIQRVDV